MTKTTDWAAYGVAVYLGLLLGGAMIGTSPVDVSGPEPVTRVELHAEPPAVDEA